MSVPEGGHFQWGEDAGLEFLGPPSREEVTALHFLPLLILQVPQEGGESSLRQLLEAFVSAGRVDHVAMVMGLHPEYLSSFWKTQYLLLRMDGPLPYHKRHYIAIMVSSGDSGCYCCSGGIWSPADGPLSDLGSPFGVGAHPGYPNTLPPGCWGRALMVRGEIPPAWSSDLQGKSSRSDVGGEGSLPWLLQGFVAEWGLTAGSPHRQQPGIGALTWWGCT